MKVGVLYIPGRRKGNMDSHFPFFFFFFTLNS